MFKMDKVDNEIVKALLLLRYYIYFKNKKLGHTDDNRKAQPFLAGLFNIYYGSNFVDCDSIQSNYKAIDLVDVDKKVAVQITSENSFEKIKNTVLKFEQESYYDNYNILKVFIIGEKKRYKKLDDLKKECEKNNYVLTVVNIYDFIDEIVQLPSFKKEEILRYIETRLDTTLARYIDYNIQKDVVTGWTHAKRFKAYINLQGGITSINEYLADIREFANVLCGLPENSRRFLVTIINYSKEHNIDSGFKFDAIKVRNNIGLPNKDFADEITILSNENFDFKDIEENNMYEIRYRSSVENYDILSEIYDYCEKENIEINDIFIDLKFNHFD